MFLSLWGRKKKKKGKGKKLWNLEFLSWKIHLWHRGKQSKQLWIMWNLQLYVVSPLNAQEQKIYLKIYLNIFFCRIIWVVCFKCWFTRQILIFFVQDNFILFTKFTSSSSFSIRWKMQNIRFCVIQKVKLMFCRTDEKKQQTYYSGIMLWGKTVSHLIYSY